jgi:hypothetical protein
MKAGPDKSVARRIANDMESRLALERAGLLDPREIAWSDAGRKPIAEHLQDWRTYPTRRSRNQTG